MYSTLDKVTRMKYGKYGITIFIFLCSIVLPLLIGDGPYLSTLTSMLLVIAAASAWSIFSGNTGYISLGHSTYYGIGAYALALFCQDLHLSGGYETFLFMPLAGLMAGVFSLPLGWVALRTRRYTFMIITIAIFFIFQVLASSLHDLTNGSTGLFLPPPTWDVAFFTIPFYYGALAILVLAMLIAWRIPSTRFGLILRAVRDDEDRVMSLGIQASWYKLFAYALSATLIGMVGAMTVFFVGYISPSSAFDQTLNIIIVTIALFGGIDSLFGPLVGGLVLEPIQAFLSQQYGATAPGINQILFGIFLLVVIVLLPRGVVTSLRTHWLARHMARAPLAVFPEPSPASTTPSTDAVLAFRDSHVLLPDTPQYEPRLQKQTMMNIPHRPLEQNIPSSPPTGFTQKIRAQKLVPVSSKETVTRQEHRAISSIGQWRCPTCHKPLLLKGNTCYCPRCGYMRPLTNSSQSDTFLPTLPKN